MDASEQGWYTRDSPTLASMNDLPTASAGQDPLLKCEMIN